MEALTTETLGHFKLVSYCKCKMGRDLLFGTDLGPFVQSIVSLTSLLVVKMLTVLVRRISNLQIFCKCKSCSHFFSKNNTVYAVFNDQSFNNTLTNHIVSFEQLGPAC